MWSGRRRERAHARAGAKNAHGGSVAMFRRNAIRELGPLPLPAGNRCEIVLSDSIFVHGRAVRVVRRDMAVLRCVDRLRSGYAGAIRLSGGQRCYAPHVVGERKQEQMRGILETCPI